MPDALAFNSNKYPYCLTRQLGYRDYEPNYREFGEDLGTPFFSISYISSRKEEWSGTAR